MQPSKTVLMYARSAIIYLVLGIFIATGASAMLGGVNELLLAQASASWSITQGTIIHSEIQSSSDSDGTTYQPIIRFTYQAKGQEFRGNKVFFGGGFSSGDISYSRRITQKYPKGKTVKVFYHPSEPQQSVLEAGLTKKSFIQLTFGASFFLVGINVGILCWLSE